MSDRLTTDNESENPTTLDVRNELRLIDKEIPEQLTDFRNRKVKTN